MFHLFLRTFRPLILPTRPLRPLQIVSVTKTVISSDFKASLARSTFGSFHEPSREYKMDKSNGTQSQIVSEPPVDPSGISTSSNVGPSDSHSMSSKFPKSYPSLNPVDIYREHISEQLASITGIGAPEIFTKLQWTQTQDKGDLMLPVPALRIKGKKPNELGAEWAEKFPKSDLVEPPTATGTFLQFFFKPQALYKLVLPLILKRRASYGCNPNLGLRDPSDPSKGKLRIVVEFSSPNIAKPFHAGHLRSTIIGGFFASLYEALGFEVVRINYLGDWGKQYGLLANGYKRFGSEEELEKNPINHLFDVYVKINEVKAPEDKEIENLKAEIKSAKAMGKDVTELESELAQKVDVTEDEKARRYFKSMEDGDPEALALWKKFRDLSIDKYKQTYARLNIRYDVYSGESQIKRESMEATQKIMAEKGITEDSEGAVIVDFTKHGAKKLGKAVVKKKDGTPLYLTRDIGAIMERYEQFKFDKMIYVIASQQDLHVAQMFKITELMGRKDIADKCQHENFGMVNGMSTRKGTVKFLDTVIEDVAEYQHAVMKKNKAKYDQVEDPYKVAETLAITSIMVQDMSSKRINNYDFSLDRMTSYEGDTGPYLQYAHARLSSITRKAELSSEDLLHAEFSLLVEPHAINLVRLLAQWPDVVQFTLKTLEPVTILSYLFKMTHMLSSSYDHLRVVGSEPELKRARMALYECARLVLNNGMKLLGLSPVERM